MHWLEEQRNKKLIEFYEFEIQNQKKKKKMLGAQPEVNSKLFNITNNKILSSTVWLTRILPLGVFFWAGTLHQFQRENYNIGFICVGLFITGLIKGIIDEKYFKKQREIWKPWEVIDKRINKLKNYIYQMNTPSSEQNHFYSRSNQFTENSPHKHTRQEVITSKIGEDSFHFQLTHPFFIFLKGKYKNNLAEGKWTIQTNWIDGYAMFQDEINCHFKNGILNGGREINYLCHKEDSRWMKALNPIGIHNPNVENKSPESRIFKTMNSFGKNWYNETQCTRIKENFLDGKLQGARQGFDDKNTKLFEERYNENFLLELKMDSLSDRRKFIAPQISDEVMSIIEYEGNRLNYEP